MRQRLTSLSAKWRTGKAMDKVFKFKKPKLWKSGGQPATKPQIATLHKLKAFCQMSDEAYSAVIQRNRYFNPDIFF